jgi:Predicted acyl-CoA transferases/carnitine dehydratase
VEGSAWRRTPGAATQFRKLFEDFAADQTKAQLYEDGQARGVSVAPVADPVDLLASPQLRDRDFFRYLEIDGQLVTVPGAPYRFAGLEVGPRAPAG